MQPSDPDSRLDFGLPGGNPEPGTPERAGRLQALALTPLFEGLGSNALQDIADRAGHRQFAAGKALCRQDEVGGSLFIIVGGLADVLVHDRPSGEALHSHLVARLRRGDVVGEMSLLTGEPRSATVVASVPTEALEVDRSAFAEIVSRHPGILANLTTILSRRLSQTNLLQSRSQRRGEAVAVVVGRSARGALPAIARAAQQARLLPTSAGPGGVAFIESDDRADAAMVTALASLDDLLTTHAYVLLGLDLDGSNVAHITAQMDRVVVLATEEEVVRARLIATREDDSPAFEWIVVSTGGGSAYAPSKRTPNGYQGMTTRSVDLTSAADISWLGRHLTRTKIGLALGAGGARGYAHVGVLQVLHEAGYTVDCVGGSSIGAMVGAWLALGMDVTKIEATMRSAFSEENVAGMFKLSMAGTSTGLGVMERVCRESTCDRTFADTVIPYLAMTADLTSRQPAPIQKGPLWEALLAATALAGMFPPYARGDQRLVDGLALVPVPADAVRSLGADIVISVNIMSRETLPAWPGEAPSEPEAKKSGSRMLDTLLEVMDLAQLDSSVRHAAMADIVLTPRFGPNSWRDFHLADRFLEAGRQVALEQLPTLRLLATPQAIPSNREAGFTSHAGEAHGAAVHV